MRIDRIYLLSAHVIALAFAEKCPKEMLGKLEWER
jgi:hypothetical protein